jgi:hypothetical protein
MENKKVEISKIVIKIGEKEATLSLEEAKQLRDVLDGLFGDRSWIYYVPYAPYIPNPNPYWTVTTTITDGTTYVTTCPKTNGISIY